MAACNIGFPQAKGDFVLFLNPDCRLDEGAVSELLRALQSDAAVGMVGGLLVNPDGSEQGGGRRAVPTPWRSFVRTFGLSRFVRRWPKLFFDFHLHKQPLPDRPIEVEAISGACMLVKREAMEDVGLLDEKYFLHCEDLDWCMRFRQKGWQILFVPDVDVLHYHGTCSADQPITVLWHKHRGTVRFYNKFFRHRYPLPLMAIIMPAVWGRFVLLAGWEAVKRIMRRSSRTVWDGDEKSVVVQSPRAYQHEELMKTSARVSRPHHQASRGVRVSAGSSDPFVPGT